MGAANELAQEVTWRGPRFSIAIVVCSVFTACGCSSAIQISDSGKSSIVFDAGILFENEASYVCIPLEKLSIDSAQEIVSIESSCECVRPSVVRYHDRPSQEGVALRLDFIKDSKG